MFTKYFKRAMAVPIVKDTFIRDSKGEIINHRIWFKNAFNPILRKLGFVIVTTLDAETEKIEGYRIRRYPF